jgi:AAA lid domain
VLAAQLADRYITGRYNPDKAIDLLDEAAAVISSQVTPPVIDALNRRLLQLEIEATGKHALLLLLVYNIIAYCAVMLSAYKLMQIICHLCNASMHVMHTASCSSADCHMLR